MKCGKIVLIALFLVGCSYEQSKKKAADVDQVSVTSVFDHDTGEFRSTAINLKWDLE